MQSSGKIKIEGDITPVEVTVKQAEKMLDALEMKRRETARRVYQTETAIRSTIRHTYSLVGSFIRLISGSVIPPMADAFIQSLVTIADTYLHTAAILSTNPATAYLAIFFAVTASMIHMVSVAKAQLGFSQAQAQIDAARTIFEEFGSMI